MPSKHLMHLPSGRLLLLPNVSLVKVCTGNTKLMLVIKFLMMPGLPTRVRRKPRRRKVCLIICCADLFSWYCISYSILMMHPIGKYTALIAVLVVGSFIIPMAQYFWYVKDDDSSDKFFAKAAEPEPEPPKKKGGWFGGGKV